MLTKNISDFFTNPAPINKRKQTTSLIPDLTKSSSEVRKQKTQEEGNMPFIPFGENEFYQIPPEEEMMMNGDSAFGSFMKTRSLKRNSSLLSGNFGGPKL